MSATALAVPTSYPESLSSRSASRALGALAQLVPDEGELSSIATSALATTWSNLLQQSALTATANSSLSTVSEMGTALNSMLAAQIRGLVEGEEPAALSEANFRSLAALTASETAIALPLPNSTATLDVPASVDSLAVTFIELLLNPYGSFPENSGQDIASNVVRLGVTSSASSRRRRLSLANETNVTIEVTMSELSATTTSAPSPNSNFSQPAVVNLTCSCGFEGNVSVTCPNGEVVSKHCDGLPGTYRVWCPMTTFGTSCSARVDDRWQLACEVVSTTPTTKCRCVVDDGATRDYSTSLLSKGDKIITQYFANVLEGVDPSRALYMFLSLLAWLCVFVGLVAYGGRLDKLDSAALRARGDMADDSTSLRRSTTIGRLVTVHSAGRIHEIQRLDDDENGDDKIKKGPSMHPIFLNESTRPRFYVALAHQHPLANWWLCHSPTVPRKVRVILLAFEILCYFFALTLEVNLVYFDANCGDQKTRAECLQFRTASWTGGGQLCAWQDCRCESHAPSFSTNTNDPKQYFVLAVVIAITYPILRMFQSIFQRVLIAPWPENIRSCCSFGKSAYAVAAGGPPTADDTDVANGDVLCKELDKGPSEDDSPPTPKRDDLLAASEDARPRITPVIVSGERKPSRVRRTVSSFADKTVRRGSTVMKGLYDDAFARHFRYGLQPRTISRSRTTQLKLRLLKLFSSVALQAERTRGATLREEARIYAPAVVGQVVTQLEELEDLAETMRQSSDPGHKPAAQCVLKLAECVRHRWHWFANYDEFLANVEHKLVGELCTAHQWRSELLKIRECLSPEAYAERSLARLHEYERVSRMSVMERLVFEACMERANFVIDAPQTPPSSLVWIAAWLGTIACVSGICYYLLSTASTLGRAHSVLWLAHLFISFFVTFVVILPVSIFVFYVWMPDLIYDRLMLRLPGSLHKMPTQAQPPYALRFLLDIDPDLRSEKAFRVVYGLHKDKTASLTTVALQHMERIYKYESWNPSTDTRLMLFAAGIFSALPCYVQNVLFEELISVVPYFASLLMRSNQAYFDIAFLPRSLSVAIVMVLTTVILGSIYVILEALRFLVRRLTRVVDADAALVEGTADDDDDDNTPRRVRRLIVAAMSGRLNRLGESAFVWQRSRRRSSLFFSSNRNPATVYAVDMDEPIPTKKEGAAPLENKMSTSLGEVRNANGADSAASDVHTSHREMRRPTAFLAGGTLPPLSRDGPPRRSA